jgi:hypothetical protein
LIARSVSALARVCIAKAAARTNAHRSADPWYALARDLRALREDKCR